MSNFQFDATAHRYTLDGLSIPSVTQIIQLAGIGTDYSNIPPVILEQKRALGVAVHEICEYVDMGAEPPYYPGVEGYVEAYCKFRREKEFIPLEAELQLYHKTLKYAGTIDRIGQIKGITAVIDLKTTASIEIGYVGPQTAAYEEAYRLWTGTKKKLPRYCLQLKSDGSYKLEQCKSKEDFQAFLAALNIYRWRERHGRITG